MQTAADVHMQTMTITRAVEIIRPRRAEDNIEILKHIGRSKIPQDCWGGILEGHIEILNPY